MIVGGTVRVPGDKSITHRALLLGAMARGTSHVAGALTSLDARSSARVLRQLGAEISPLRVGSTVSVVGRGRLRRPDDILDCGNSGTTTRLLLGLLAGQRFAATLTGDGSLRRRPMRRVTGPLERMGARITEHSGDGLPLTIRGGKLLPLRHELPVSSAQIKSALLLAGLAGGVEVELREPARTIPGSHRADASGVRVRGRGAGWVDSLRAHRPHRAVRARGSRRPVLGGVSRRRRGAGRRRQVRIPGVGVNPTRTGLLRVLERMGATVEVEGVADRFGEPVADLVARPAPLRATEVGPGEIPGLIDEIPLLAVLAARASGTTVFREVGELRVKESDRLSLIVENLESVGGRAAVVGDDLHVEGGLEAPRGPVRSAGDHRMAMAFAVLGTVPGASIRVDDMACAAVSFPGFPETLRALARRGRS